MIIDIQPELDLPTLGELVGDSSDETILGDDLVSAARITDLAVTAGGNFDSSSETAQDGDYLTRTPRDGKVAIINSDGEVQTIGGNSASASFRPVIRSKEFFEKIKPYLYKNEDGFYEVEYGYYPLFAATSDLQETLSIELNKMLNSKPTELTNTKFKFNFNNAGYKTEFSADGHSVLEYRGRYFICKEVTLNPPLEKFYPESLNGNVCISNNTETWIEVLPVQWLADPEKEILISKYGLISGIPFDTKDEYTGDFTNTIAKEYLKTCLGPDLHNSQEAFKGLKVVKSQKKKGEKINPYGFDFGEVSEEDIIRGSVESDVPVFLHAKSGDGKSARAKELDPDCTIIYMRTATPDSLNGKSVYNSQTGEMIDVKPSWLKKLEEKCAKEPDKLHILFFDELTNALPSIQSMAFNIVLDKEVNGIWKLPENSRIIAAGNDMEDSLAANQMAEPLFNRFAHVYIETTPEEWLEWATTPEEDYERLEYKKSEKRSKIHPAIYAFIAGNTYSDRGASVLRTKPKTDELKPHADPRKWELASKVLYATNNPEMLRGLIGTELTTEFVEFTQVKTITVEDVINGDYTENDLRMNTAEKFATAVGLSSVDEEHFAVVREFMLKIGAEPCAAFESMWHHGNQKRLMMIAEAQISQGGRMI